MNGTYADIEIISVENGWIVNDNFNEMAGAKAVTYVFNDPAKLGAFVSEWSKGKQKTRVNDRPMNAEAGN